MGFVGVFDRASGIGLIGWFIGGKIRDAGIIGKTGN